MTATTFSRQNDASLLVSTTYYWENLVLVVILVLESKGLYCWEYAKNHASNAWSTDNKFSSFKKHLQVFECDDRIKLQRIKKQSFYWIRLLKFFFFTKKIS